MLVPHDRQHKENRAKPRFRGAAAVLAGLCLLGAWPSTAGVRLLSENEAYRVVLASADTTDEALAERYLGSAQHAWRIKALNGNRPDGASQRVTVVPKGWANPTGIQAGKLPVVPILTYHRFGPRPSQLMVTLESFRQQLTHLRDNGYTVVPLRAFRDYLSGTSSLPPKAVVITIDDGYQSTFRLAMPLLLEFGMPATVFVYTDFVNRGGLKTRQMRAMLDSGLIDIQSHSKTHANLAQRLEDESDEAYAQRLIEEVAAPKKRLEKLLDHQIYAFAYPYGATSEAVVEQTKRTRHDLSLTVKRGSNAFYQHPQLIKRSMVFGGDDLKKFAKTLRTESSF